MAVVFACGVGFLGFPGLDHVTVFCAHRMNLRRVREARQYRSKDILQVNGNEARPAGREQSAQWQTLLCVRGSCSTALHAVVLTFGCACVGAGADGPGAAGGIGDGAAAAGSAGGGGAAGA